MANILPNEEANFTEVFRTGRLWEIELVASELKKQKVPFYQEEQTSAGLRLAKPVMPNMAPGVWWVIFSPEVSAEQAKSIINNLPIEVSDSLGVWHYNSCRQSKMFKWYGLATLASFLVWLLYIVFDLATEILNF